MKAVPTYFSSLLAQTPLDDSTISMDWNEYKTTDLNLVSNNRQSNIRYRVVVKDTDSYLLLSKSYLLVQFSLATDAAVPTAVGDQIVTLAAAGAGLFQRIELLGNDSQIDICDNPQYVQLINALLDYNKDKLESVAESEWLSLDFAKPVGALDVAGTNDNIMLSSTQFAGTAAAVWEHGSGCAVVREYVSGVAPAAAGVAPNIVYTQNVSVGAPHPNFNPGFLFRWNRTRSGRKAEIACPMSSVLGYCRDIQTVSTGIKWELNLDKTTNYDQILHGAQRVTTASGGVGADPNADPKFQTLIHKISWWIPQVTPSLTMKQDLLTQLNSGVISKQYFENMTCKFSEDYPQGTVDVDFIVNLEGHKPSRIYFAAQRTAQYNTTNDILLIADGTENYALMDQTHANGSAFSYLGNYNPAQGAALVTGGITETSLRINSRNLPREKYTLNFSDTNTEFMRAYVDFIKSSGKWSDGDGAALSPDEYRNLYPIFAFDLRDYSADVFSGVKQNDVRFNMRIAAGAPSDFRIVYVIMSERELVVQAINGKLSLKV